MKIISGKRTMRLSAIGIAFSTILAFGVSPASGEIVGVIDSYELADEPDLTGWTVSITQILTGSAVNLCGYQVRASAVTAMTADGVDMGIALLWLLDTSGAVLDAPQLLKVTSVSDCADMSGMWILNLSPLAAP